MFRFRLTKKISHPKKGFEMTEKNNKTFKINELASQMIRFRLGKST